MGNSQAAHFGRLAEMIDVSALADRVEGVVGLGRAGSGIVSERRCFPIGHLHAFDGDEVSVRDIDDVYSTCDIGSHKVGALARLIRRWEIPCHYSGYPTNISRTNIDRFVGIARGFDLLSWCADDWELLTIVSEQLHSTIPMVGTAFAEGGAYGEVAFSIPGQTPPLSETLVASSRVRSEGAASLPLDVHLVANIAVRISLGIALIGKKGYGLFSPYLDPDHPLVVIQSRPNRFTRSRNELVPQLTRLVALT